MEVVLLKHLASGPVPPVRSPSQLRVEAFVPVPPLLYHLVDPDDQRLIPEGLGHGCLVEPQLGGDDGPTFRDLGQVEPEASGPPWGGGGGGVLFCCPDTQNKICEPAFVILLCSSS